MYDITSPLTDRQAERLRNELKKRGIDAKLRELRMYAPTDLSGTIGLSPENIAKMAGRPDNPPVVPVA